MVTVYPTVHLSRRIYSFILRHVHVSTAVEMQLEGNFRSLSTSQQTSLYTQIMAERGHRGR